MAALDQTNRFRRCVPRTLPLLLKLRGLLDPFASDRPEEEASTLLHDCTGVVISLDYSPVALAVHCSSSSPSSSVKNSFDRFGDTVASAAATVAAHGGDVVSLEASRMTVAMHYGALESRTPTLVHALLCATKLAELPGPCRVGLSSGHFQLAVVGAADEPSSRCQCILVGSAAWRAIGGAHRARAARVVVSPSSAFEGVARELGLALFEERLGSEASVLCVRAGVHAQFRLEER